MKKIFLFVLITFFSSFCGATQTSKKLTVVLDWFINPDHAPLVVAQQKGFFKEQGLDVTFIGPADPADPPKWVAAGKADIGITYQPELMQQIDQGLPLISIGTLIDKPLNCLVTLKNGSIKSLADLKGKQIGTSSGLSDLMLKVMLEKNGLQASDVEIINVHYNLTQALLTRKVDAVAGLQRNVEVPQLEADNHKITAFFPEEYGVPNYNELIFIIHTASAQDERYPKFLEAIRKATVYLEQHPQETWKQFAKQYPEANNSANRQSWFATLPYFTENPGAYEKNEWDRFASFMKQNKLIKTALPASRYAVQLTKDS